MVLALIKVLPKDKHSNYGIECGGCKQRKCDACVKSELVAAKYVDSDGDSKESKKVVYCRNCLIWCGEKEGAENAFEEYYYPQHTALRNTGEMACAGGCTRLFCKACVSHANGAGATKPCSACRQPLCAYCVITCYLCWKLKRSDRPPLCKEAGTEEHRTDQQLCPTCCELQYTQDIDKCLESSRSDMLTPRRRRSRSRSPCPASYRSRERSRERKH
jgi:hypothetical protein